MTRRYIIIGAGAIGGAVGGRLALAGLDTVLVARGDTFRPCNAQGSGSAPRTRTSPCRSGAVGGPDEIELRAADVLVLSTKTQQADDALRPGPMRRWPTTSGRGARPASGYPS